MKYTVNCLNCGKEFTAKTRRAKYCSDYCRVDYNRKIKLPKIWTPVSETNEPKKFNGSKTKAIEFDEVGAYQSNDPTITLKDIKAGILKTINDKKEEIGRLGSGPLALRIKKKLEADIQSLQNQLK